MKKLFLIYFMSFLVQNNGISQASNSAKQEFGIELLRNSLINQPFRISKSRDINGKTITKEALKGKVVVINFWFTTCGPCIREIPHLNELVKQNKQNDILFLAPAPDEKERIEKFLNKHPFEYNIIPSSLDLINSLKIENFPTHLVIDKSGIIRDVFIGYSDDINDKLQTAIDKLTH